MCGGVFNILQFSFCNELDFDFCHCKDTEHAYEPKKIKPDGVTPEHAHALLGTANGRPEVPGPWIGNPLSNPSFLCTSSSVVTSASFGGGGAGGEALLCSHVDVCCLRGW